MSSSLLRVGGWAAVLGGLLYVALGAAYFVFTHGSGQSPRGGTLFGLDATDYCRLEPVRPVLLMIGLAVFHGRQARHASRWGRRGFVAAMTALATVALGWVLQCWVVDPDMYFDSLLVTGGFYSGALANLALMVSMIAYGIVSVRARVLSPWWKALPLAIGLLGMATGLVEATVLSGVSEPGLTRDLVFTMYRLPWSLGWMLLGYSLLAGKV